MTIQAAPRSAARVTIYTDGGARPNPGPGGWGAVLLTPGEGGDPEVRELSGGARHTTNNRMELTAAICALEALPVGSRARLYTDSQYLRRGITEWLPGWVSRGWRKKDGGAVENDDLWRRLAEVAADHDVAWSWVRGHTGQRWNERADALATAGARPFRPVPRGRGGEGAVEEGGAAAEPAAPRAEVFLKVSCRAGRGGWVARLRSEGGERLLSGQGANTSPNRLDLEAAAAALAALPPDLPAAIYTASEYLRQGATVWLAGWRRRGWRTKDGGEVKNRDAWERLAALLAARPVAWPPVDEAARAEIAGLEEAVAQGKAETD